MALTHTGTGAHPRQSCFWDMALTRTTHGPHRSQYSGIGIDTDFDPDSVAWRVRQCRYGWEIDTQPSSGELLLGPGPLIIDGRTGDYWKTSSNPSDVFGGSGALGWSELKSRRLFEQWKHERAGPDGNIFDADAPIK